jgi:hypothetical protein
MKKMLFCLAALGLFLPAMAQDLSLRVMSGSPGEVDAKTIDVATLTAGDAFVLEVVLENLNFTLAGAEFEVKFPAWLVLARVDLVNDPTPANWPFDVDEASLGTSAVQRLPSDGAGDNTAATFDNPNGIERVGFVITEPADRPTSGDVVLAKLRFAVGRDYNESPVSARTLDTCISATSSIQLTACNSGAPECQILADENANAVAAVFTGPDVTVAVNNTDTTLVKGDGNNTGTVDSFDLLANIRCVIFGQDPVNCSALSALTTDEFEQIMDCNCDGAVNSFDLLPCIKKAAGVILRRNVNDNNKRGTFYSLSDAGMLQVDNGARMAAVSIIELGITGRVDFDRELQLSKAAQDNGWGVVADFIPESNSYKIALFNTKAMDAPLPDLTIPYMVQGGRAQIQVIAVDSYKANNEQVPFVPALTDHEIAQERAISEDQ